MELYLFYFLGGLAVATAAGVIFFKNPISSAFSLVVSFFAMAGIYALLQAHFLAIIQILVYVGAIMVLFIFVIMLLNLQADELEEKKFRTGFKVLLFIVGAGLLALLIPLFRNLSSIPAKLNDDFGTVKSVGTLLFQEYAFAFEYVSILLLVALIGGVILAKRKLS